ncbi:MAG: class I SAM-dependent methyltransferase, partial [Dehalococcoidia bacterium]|nr:class I SAM-dependent methyltransferase [Dehalococcoidia bacterium]
KCHFCKRGERYDWTGRVERVRQATPPARAPSLPPMASQVRPALYLAPRVTTMADDTERRCRAVLERAGLEEGQVVLDFGCGSGNYSIPAAKIVKHTGKVYAVDSDSSRLKELAGRVESEGLGNIETIGTGGELDFPWEDGSIDTVLLYDIFWYFPTDDRRLPRLLAEVGRLLKPGGLLSVFPEHVEAEALGRKVERAGFRPENSFSCQVIHDGSTQQGQILNFSKPVAGGPSPRN